LKKILSTQFPSAVKWMTQWKGEEYGQNGKQFTGGKKVASHKERANAGGNCLARL
jgi:hypothetical protein